jgi:5-carboxymethyl-2-hydroxymuconate isomerase
MARQHRPKLLHDSFARPQQGHGQGPARLSWFCDIALDWHGYSFNMLSNSGSTPMPHFRIEYSANILARVDISEFCTVIHRAIMETELFELGAVRVRAFRADYYAIADQLPENGFLDMQFAVGQGRKPDELKRAGEHIFKIASEHLAPLFNTPHFALSFQISEINGNLSWKKNAMHPRLRNT